MTSVCYLKKNYVLQHEPLPDSFILITLILKKQKSMILTDELLMAAFCYRESNLWNYLDDSMVFAFRLSDGETGYCCVMGHAGEHLSLGFYRGPKDSPLT